MSPDAPVLSHRTLTVLAYLLADPDVEHQPVRVASRLGMTTSVVNSVFAALVAYGWLVRRDLAVALTPLGRRAGADAVADGGPGVPLRQVDAEDPQLADRVRAMMGWPPKHTG